MITTHEQEEEARRNAWIIWGNMRKLQAGDQRRIMRIMRRTAALNRWPQVAALYLKIEAWRIAGRHGKA